MDSINSEQHIVVALDQLRPHPRNYQVHPEDEITHLMQSIREHGFYRNIVVASDGVTILAGHGVVEAARRLAIKDVPAYRTEYSPDDPRALKLLAGDNEISHLAMKDDRALTELLKELNDTDLGLLGTGYDNQMLANLLFVTRPASEIADLDAAAHWVGMPEYDGGAVQIQIVINFTSEEDCQEFCRLNSLKRDKIALHGAMKSFWWPERALDDSVSILFTDRKGEV